MKIEITTATNGFMIRIFKSGFAGFEQAEKTLVAMNAKQAAEIVEQVLNGKA